MKLQLVKFNHTVLFEGQQVSFLDSEKHKVMIDYDPKTLIVSLLSNKDYIQTNLSNCIYWKLAEQK